MKSTCFRAYDFQVVSDTAKMLDEIGCEYPVIAIQEFIEEVVVNYSKATVALKVDAGVLSVLAVACHATEFVVPSICAAIEFMVEVESIRQQRQAPYLQFATKNLQTKLIGEF